MAASADHAGVIEYEQAIRQASDDPAFLLELLADFLGDEEKAIGNLAAAHSARDFKAYREAAHYIKGGALALALASLSSVAKSAEYTAKALETAPTDRQEIECLGSVQKRDKLVGDLALLLAQIRHEYKRVRAYLDSKRGEAP